MTTRIAFCVNWGSGRDSGIFRKVVSQAAAWQAQGAEVALFVTTSAAGVEDWTAVPQTAYAVAAAPRPGGRLRAREQAARAARRWRPDVVYTRHGLVYPGLFRLGRQAPLVVEINGDELAESRGAGLRPYAVARLSHGPGLRLAAGLVFVTHELAARPAFARYGRPFVVVPNGIDTSTVERVPVAPGEHRLVFLGHPGTPWHGADKLVEIARRLPGWRVDVVGPSPADLPGPLPDNLVAHGLLQTPEYAPLLRQADVAIGSIAMNRAGIEEASPLKVREYLAAGLPTVIGYRDSDFPDDAEFLLRLANTEDNVAEAVQRIPGFATSWQGRRVPAAAVHHLDSAEKERVRLAFLERCAQAGQGS